MAEIKNMQGVDDAKDDPQIYRMIKETTKQLIAVPCSCKHEKGKAVDIGGLADAEQAKTLL